MIQAFIDQDWGKHYSHKYFSNFPLLCIGSREEHKVSETLAKWGFLKKPNLVKKKLSLLANKWMLSWKRIFVFPGQNTLKTKMLSCPESLPAFHPCSIILNEFIYFLGNSNKVAYKWVPLSACEHLANTRRQLYHPIISSGCNYTAGMDSIWTLLTVAASNSQSVCMYRFIT